MRLRIGTRKSAMALAQTEEIARRLTAAAPDVDVEIVKFETWLRKMLRTSESGH